MARTFGQDGDDKKESNDDKRTYSHPEGAAALPVPQNEPPPLEVIEEVAEEGRHLYLDFIRTEISRNGLNDSCIDAPDSPSIIDDPKKYVSV